jgi:hypothetical protein
MNCDHVSCGCSDKIWLPYKYKGRERGLRPHPYCLKCGVVKRIGSDKPHGIGYYINLLSAINCISKITKVQMRMMSIEISDSCIADTYAVDRSMQEALFIKIVKKYTNVREDELKKLLMLDA